MLAAALRRHRWIVKLLTAIVVEVVTTVLIRIILPV